MANSKGRSKADKFSSLFDQDWSNTKSRLRTRIESNQRAYDLTNSWDARSDNPQSFSRLDQTLVPYQPSAPIVLSGTAVVQLERNEGFNAINVKQPSHEVSKVPLTVDQQAIGMTNDLSGKVPILERAVSRGKVLIMEQAPSFQNMSVQQPKVVESTIPAFVQQAGPQGDQCLLNPRQQREMLKFELEKQRADKLVRQAVVDRQKVRNQLNSIKFHRGALMLDSSDNIDSEVYGEKARREMAEKEYMRQIHLERESRLAVKQSSLATNGNILVPETIGPRVKLEKFYQSKGGNYHALSFDETHNRLFCRLQGASSSDRTQLLRDIDLSGKDYNITQHTLIEHWPPREFPRQVDHRMEHPSQATLEGNRNLQGTLRPI